MNAPVPIVFIVTILLALAAGNLSEGDPGVVTVYSADVGDFSWSGETAPIDHRIALVLNATGLEKLAAETPTIQSAVGEADPDFDEEMLLVAAMGSMPTGGYEIRVVSVQVFPEPSGRHRVTVRLAADEPDEDDMVTQAFTYPVDAVAIERSRWPAGVLDELSERRVAVEVMDQDGRPWGPAFIYYGEEPDPNDDDPADDHPDDSDVFRQP